ncbi:MAG TPA: hypothetical protein VIL48_05850 [Acidimicrobiales bacterium]
MISDEAPSASPEVRHRSAGDRPDAPAGARRPDGAERATTAPTQAAPPSTSERHIGVAGVKGAIAGFLVLVPIAGGISLLAGFDPLGALGIGAFAGIWGGPGFGGMLGATLAYTRTERRRHTGAQV